MPLSAIGSRRALGVLVVMSVVLLQGTADYVAGRGIARVVFLLVEMPILMLALSAQHAWTERRNTTAAGSLLSGMATATVLGCVFGVLFSKLSEHVPEIRFHFPNTTVSTPRSALFGVLSAQLYFGLWALAFVYPLAVESARIRSLQAQQLRSETELAQLRAHLEPHFLLNTLNTIAGLVTEDPREARRLIVCLGDLLRDAVQERGEVERLDRQITWLRRYAEILEARHPKLLKFEWNVAKDVENETMPRMLLQPLVENAVKHGALKRTGGGGKVSIDAHCDASGMLVFTVEDNGPGMPAEIRKGAFGIQSVRRRLELESNAATLRFESSATGTRAIVVLPRDK